MPAKSRVTEPPDHCERLLPLHIGHDSAKEVEGYLPMFAVTSA